MLRSDWLSYYKAIQAIRYYVMVRFRTIDLKSHPIAQFKENCIIRKKNAKFK